MSVLAPTGRWVRVLANECIKKLCPVHFHSNGSEYVMALTTGKHEGYVHFGTITGKVGTWYLRTLSLLRILTPGPHPSPYSFRRGPRLEVLPVSRYGLTPL